MIKKNLCLIKKFYKDIRLSSLLLFIVFLLAAVQYAEPDRQI